MPGPFAIGSKSSRASAQVIYPQELRVLFVDLRQIVEAAEVGGHHDAASFVATQADAAAAGEDAGFARAIADVR